MGLPSLHSLSFFPSLSLSLSLSLQFLTPFSIHTSIFLSIVSPRPLPLFSLLIPCLSVCLSVSSVCLGVAHRISVHDAGRSLGQSVRSGSIFAEIIYTLL